jgi:hypothetical protein
MPGAIMALAGAEEAGFSATRESAVAEVGSDVVDDGAGVTGVAGDTAAWRLWSAARSEGSGAGAACAGRA